MKYSKTLIFSYFCEYDNANNCKIYYKKFETMNISYYILYIKVEAERVES